MPSDRLFFLDGYGRRMYDAIWDGPWPPPAKLSLMKGLRSGEIAVFEPDKAPADVVEMARDLGSIIETRFKLRNASQMPEAASDDAHWFRGAEYVPEGDDA